METLTRREREVVTEVVRHARKWGRWPTMRDVSAAIGRREGKPCLSMASTYRSLVAKGILQRFGRQWGVKGLIVRVIKAEVVPDPKSKPAHRASRDALCVL